MDADHAQFEELIFYAKMFGILGIPLAMALFGWLFALDQRTRHIQRVGDELMDMHENPEKTGFGTVGMERVIQDDTRALREMSHYVRWSTKEQTGKDAPPYMAEDG